METSDKHLRIKSDCAKCKNNNGYMKCDAYPSGIPTEITEGKQKHRSVRSDQTGNTVFESILTDKTQKQ